MQSIHKKLEENAEMESLQKNLNHLNHHPGLLSSPTRSPIIDSKGSIRNTLDAKKYCM